MTLENCRRLLKHYEATGQTDHAAAMRERIARKETLPKYAVSKPTKTKGKD